MLYTPLIFSALSFVSPELGYYFYPSMGDGSCFFDCYYMTIVTWSFTTDDVYLMTVT